MRRHSKSIIALILTLILGLAPLPTLASSTNPTKGGSRPVVERMAPLTRRARRANIKPQKSPAVEGQTATQLPDGRWLLIGGKGPGGPITSITISDPRTGADLRMASDHQARAWHSATMLPDGRVLIAGGIGVNGEVLNNAEILDLDSKSFESLPAGRLTPRAFHTATLLTDGHVLFVGGVSARGKALASAELWDTRAKSTLVLPARLTTPRQHHKATLLTDGNVLIEGGEADGEKIVETEVFNTHDQSFSNSALSSESPDDSLPYVSGSVPENGSANVALDSLIAVRFSKSMVPETVNREALKVLGPQGPMNAKIVSAENGRLAFVNTEKPLEAGTTYSLSIMNAADNSSHLIPSTAITFTTVGKQISDNMVAASNSLTGDEEWKPDSSNLRGNWRSKNKKSSLQDLPPLQAEPGVTALAGQVLLLNGRALANVAVKIGDQSVLTDNTGRFLLSAISDGHQVMKLDGRTASRPGRVFGTFKIGVNITKSRTNVLPYTIWMPKLDMAHAVQIGSPTKRDLVITNPQIPGLELRLPRGTVIRDMDGRTVTEISITPIPTNQPPFPLPEGIHVPVFFTIQPGGAQIIPPRAQLVYPNFTSARPGARIAFWNYDASGKGWYFYGKGTVTANGKQIVPDPGVVLYEFSGAMVANPNIAPDEGPPPCGSCPDGDPVDLSTGLFLYQKTDLVLPDVIPASATRTYRPRDDYTDGFLFRPFGYGTTDPYDIFLVGDSFPWTYAELVMPNGGRVHYDRISPGTDFTDAVFEATATPGAFYKSRLAYNGNGWDLTLRDKTVYLFPISISAFTQQQAALSGIRDRNGNVLKLIRNDNHQTLRKVVTPNGRWLEFTYDALDRITKVEDNIGRTVGYQYDADWQLWKVTNVDGGVTEYTYDSSHRMVSIKDARGITYLTNEYDSDGNVFRQTQADGSVFQFAYTRNVNGKIVQTEVTDPLGHVRRVTFNAGGYVLTDTAATGTADEQTVTYDRAMGTNLVSSVIDSLGRRTNYGRDSLGNVVSVTNLAGTSNAITTSFAYESVFNQVTSITDPLERTTSFTYDSKGNLTSVTDPLDHQISFTHNSAGQMLSFTDPLSHTTHFSYDSGNLTEVEDPLGRVVSRYFDGAGRPVLVHNPLGESAKIKYNPANRPTEVIDSMGNSILWTYDPNGNILSLTDPRGSVTSFSYDNMDRLASRTDPLLHVESIEYDIAGNPKKITDRKGSVSVFSYDNLNRRKFNGFGMTGEPSSPNYESSTTYTYDGGNRLTSITDSNSGSITVGYDDLDRQTSESTANGTVSYSYDAVGRRTGMTVTGQQAISYDYDDADRLTQITQGSASVAMAYDAAGRRTLLTLPNGISISYARDAASQLTEITYMRGQDVLGNLTYAYDSAGRKTKLGGSFARTLIPNAIGGTTYNAANQISGSGWSYDANGNLTSDGTNTYSWNARNQLTSISGPGLAASFQYDAFGRRVTRSVNGAAISYLYDGSDVVQELAGGNVAANMLVGGIDELFTRTDASGTHQVISDAHGSSLGLIDSSGAIGTEYTYEPFGRTTSTGTAASNSSQYAGRENDGTGLYYNRARYYSPTLQRFISEDPIGFGGGDVNFYAYANNDPIDFSDPHGLQGNEDLGLGYTGRVDPFNSGEGFEIHVFDPSGKEIGICSGRLGWIAKHGFPSTPPPGIPRDVLNKLNGLNVNELRGRGLIPEKGIAVPGEEGGIRGGSYLNPGRTLFRTVAVLNVLMLAMSLLDEYNAEKDLQKRADKHGLTPEQQFFKDSERLGHPQFYMTPLGPMPNPYFDPRNRPALEARLERQSPPPAGISQTNELPRRRIGVQLNK